MTTLNTRDPVQGLIDYALDAKPYHSKVVEVWVEYLYGDKITALVTDRLDMSVDVALDRVLRYCPTGWDTSPWGKLLTDLYIDDLVPGLITYATGKTVKRSVAYQLYFDYLCDQWRFTLGEGKQPVISSVPTSKYYVLSFPSVMTPAQAYFAAIDDRIPYWYDLTHDAVFVKNGPTWLPQLATISPSAPLTPAINAVWVNTISMKLYISEATGWQENTNFYASHDEPIPLPHYPPEWTSTWDRPECTPPYGENWAQANIAEKLVIQIIDV